MKYYIIAGEPSGDLHGSNLVKELKKIDPQAAFRCWGGDLMQEAGATVVKHYKELAFMGFVEIVRNLPAILENFKFGKRDILAFQPDALILIDYPGFNLRMAKWAKNKGFKVIYYISPQVWAWKENRVRTIRQFVDKMLVILPFEKDFYKKWNVEVEYVGHPLVEVIDEFRKKNNPTDLKEEFSGLLSGNPEIPMVALLPGSRRQEITKKLPVMLRASKLFPQYRFIVAQAPAQDPEFYRELLKDFPAVSCVSGRTYELLAMANAACVTSGTATLETALFRVPEVVCYKSSSVSYQIAKRLIRVKYISLVNLIMDKPVVKELIQGELTPDRLGHELDDLLHNPERRRQLDADYENLRKILGGKGNPSANAARSIFESLQV
jgi:lipid-A-disaccharide synthase